MVITLTNIKNANQGALKRKNLLAKAINFYVIKDNRNKLILQYLKTRRCKYYTLIIRTLVIMIQYYNVNRNIPQLCSVL